MTEKPRPGTEGSWSDWEAVEDGGREPVTPMSVLRSSLGDDEQLRAVVPMSRDGDDVTGLVVREAPAKDGDGTVVHLRTATIDPEQREVRYHDNGMFLNRTGNLPPALLKAVAALRDGGDGFVANGLDAGDDDLARRIMSEPVEDGEPEPEPEGEVLCRRCESMVEVEDAEQFSSGPPLGEIWVHADGCPEGSEHE